MAPKISCTEVAVPADSLAMLALPDADFIDAHQVIVDGYLSRDPHWWNNQLLLDLPGPVARLMAARNTVVKRFGLVVSEDPSALPFPELGATDREVLCGFDDAHLRFRCSVRVAPIGEDLAVTFETVVKFNGVAGRAYFVPVKPIHRRYVIPAMLRRAARVAYEQRANAARL